jgi:hypothetical protein
MPNSTSERSRADRVVGLPGNGAIVHPPDAFLCKMCGSAVPGAFRRRGELPQLNVPAMEGHLHRQHLEAWQRLTAEVRSTADLPAVLAEAFEPPVANSRDC